MAKNFRELVCWQLAVEIRDKVLPLLTRPRVRHDFKFCTQLADAVRSPPRNIAEGYGRFKPKETAHFLDYARASLDETETHLRDGVTSSYFPAETVAPLIVLIARCRKAINSWHRYLRRVQDDPRFRRKKPPDDEPSF